MRRGLRRSWKVKMPHALHDPVRHNAWATTQLLEFCRRLDEQTLHASVPGTYGTIIVPLRHIIYCEIDLLDRLLGAVRVESTVPRRCARLNSAVRLAFSTS